MRVIAGTYRHRELIPPYGEVTRPTKDMVKEGLFSALGDKPVDAKVLDLFAGSGALGIEALSRGAKFAYFVDSDYNAHKTINLNLKNLKIKDAMVYRLDYKEAISRLKKGKVKIDILFIDPPYKMDEYAKIIDEASKLLSDDAAVVVESDKLFAPINGFKKIKEYKYGKTIITILWK